MAQQQRFLDRFSFREEYRTTRGIKAEKILAVVQRQTGDRRSLLDIGCGESKLAERAATLFGFVAAVDQEVPRTPLSSESNFLRADGCQLPFASGSFDVVVSNHIFEHVSDSTALMAETWRVLRPGGFCYFSCPNRFRLIEPHYRLPLLAWLPRRWSDYYVRCARKGDRYLDNPPSYSRLKEEAGKFVFTDVTIEILNHPEQYFPNDARLCAIAKVVRRVPIFLQRWLLPLFPVWIVILRKPQTD
jgi:SAM-dependent methyltransferase